MIQMRWILAFIIAANTIADAFGRQTTGTLGVIDVLTAVLAIGSAYLLAATSRWN